MKKKSEIVKKKADSEILVPEKIIAGYKVCPWGICEISELSEVIAIICSKCKEKEITLENINEKKIDFTKIVLVYAPEILRITLGMKSIEDLKKIQPRSASIEMMLEIIGQNLEYLKNLFGLSSVLDHLIKNQK